MKGVFLLILVLLSAFVTFGQQNKIDSLEAVLSVESDLSVKVAIIEKLVKLYNLDSEAELYIKSVLDITINAESSVRFKALDLAYYYYVKIAEYDQAIELKQFAFQLSSQQKDNKNLGSSHYDIGYAYIKKYVLDSAIVHFKKANTFFEMENDWKNNVLTLNRLGIIEKDLGNYAAALSYYHEAFGIANANKLKKELGSTCTNIGVVLKKQGQLEEALSYYYKAEGYYLDLNHFIGLANVYNNIGNVLRIQEEYDLALKNYRLAIANREKGNSEKSLSYSYNNIALIFKEKAQYDSALHYLSISEAYKFKLNEQSSLTSTYLNFTETYLQLNDSVNFILYYDKAEKYAEDFNQLSTLQELYLTRSKFESKHGNFEGAYSYLLKVVKQLDKLDANQQITLGKVLQAKFQDEQKQEMITQLQRSNQELDEKSKELEKGKENFTLMTYGLIAVSIILVMILLVLLRNIIALKKGSDELKVINEELARTRLSSEEKDVLIKEIHHRVKNNLQIIISLFRLQSHFTDNEEALELFKSSQNRIRSMSKIHEKLYETEDLSKVEMKTYIEELVDDLVTSYDVNNSVSVERHIQNCSINLNELTPFALVLNEVITNSLKYGFENVEDPCIRISLKQTVLGDTTVVISDNGPGFDNEIWENHKTMGMELIKTLTEQLDGSIILDQSSGHPVFTLKFKAS